MGWTSACVQVHGMSNTQATINQASRQATDQPTRMQAACIACVLVELPHCKGRMRMQSSKRRQQSKAKRKQRAIKQTEFFDLLDNVLDEINAQKNHIRCVKYWVKHLVEPKIWEEYAMDKKLGWTPGFL